MSITQKTCKIEDCESKHKGHGYCNKHLKRYRKYGDATFTKQLHGENRHQDPLYSTYCGMKDRCRNNKNYAGKNRIVADVWDGPYGFTKFKEYIEKYLGPKPSNRFSIDRINNDLGYFPGNIRWATYSQQAQNKDHRKGKTGYQGVTQVGSKFRVRIGFEGKRINGGVFETIEEAIETRKQLESKYWN